MMIANNKGFSKVIAIWMILWSFCFLVPPVLAVESEIQIGCSASWLDKHAAEELQKYIQLLTGEQANIVSSDKLSKSQPLFLIGTVDSNPAVRRLTDEGRLELMGIKDDNDEFIVKTIKDRNVSIIVLSGNNGRSTLYAVYDYLEDDCGIGFFPDGEYIPSLKSLPLKDIDRVENARFQNRLYLRWDRVVMKKYTTRWHNWPELKEAIDWEAKKKFNIRSAYAIDTEGRGMGGIIEDVFDLPPEPEELCAIMEGGNWWHINWFLPLDYCLARKEKALAYSRQLGFRTDIGVSYGVVPRRYKQNHPEHQYVACAGFNLAPKDPAATRFTKELLRRTVERFGTDHFYSMNPYGEQAPGKDPLQLKIDASINTANLLSELDASCEFLWRLDSWDFMFNPGDIWTRQNVKKYLDAMPNFLYIADNCFDLLPEPLYRTYDYFHGKKWALAPINDLGGDDHLHGNIADVLQKALEVTDNPKGKNCIGFHFTPENANCNIMYWNCLCRLAWNPEGWTQDKLIKDFCVHRYGRDSSENMIKAWEIIVDNMTHVGGGAHYSPLYQLLRANVPHWKADFPRRLEVAQKCGPSYREALTLALQEWKEQKDNILYENDLIDILRTYIGKLSDYYFISAVRALEDKDKQSYLAMREKVFELLRLGAKLMSTRSDYSLSDTIRFIKTIPGANRYAEVGLKMSQYGFNGYDTFDNYEEMVFAYIPMVEYVLDKMAQECLSETATLEFQDGHDPIKRKWLLSPLDPPPETRFDGNPREAIRYVITKIDSVTGIK